jgi:hypothetical protein
MEVWLHVGYIFGTYMAGIMTSAAYVYQKGKKHNKMIKIIKEKDSKAQRGDNASMPRV